MSSESTMNGSMNGVGAKFVQIDGFNLPDLYLKSKDAIENFEVFDDDIWVCGLSRSGWYELMFVQLKFYMLPNIAFQFTEHIIQRKYPV